MLDVAGYYNYWIAVILMMIGFYGVIASANLVKKLAALGVFQAAVFLLYISMGIVEGGSAPILPYEYAKKLAAGGTDPNLYSNPLPHVLILTAIVVGVATLSMGLALVVRIREEYGTIEEDEIIRDDDIQDTAHRLNLEKNEEASS